MAPRILTTAASTKLRRAQEASQAMKEYEAKGLEAMSYLWLQPSADRLPDYG